MVYLSYNLCCKYWNMSETLGNPEAPILDIELLDEDVILAKLDELGNQIDAKTLREVALIILWENRARFEDIWHDIDIVNVSENNSLYLSIGTEAIKIPTSNESEIATFCDDLYNVLSDTRTLAITWDINERTIVEIDWLFDDEILSKNVPSTWYDEKDKQPENISEMVSSNNYVEELYKFTQKVKWVPEIDWKILSTKILASWESTTDFFDNMWQQEDDVLSYVKNLLDMKKSWIQDYQD